MIKHTVIWKVKKDQEGNIPPSTITYIKDQLLSLKTRLPYIQSLLVGENLLEKSDQIGDLILETLFENSEDLNQYTKDPYHLEVVANIKDFFTERRVIDYMVS